VRVVNPGCGWGIAAFTSLEQLPAMVAAPTSCRAPSAWTSPSRSPPCRPTDPTSLRTWTATCAACRWREKV